MKAIELGSFTIPHSYNEIMEIKVRLITTQANHPCTLCSAPNPSGHNVMLTWVKITMREEARGWVVTNWDNPKIGAAHVACANQATRNQKGPPHLMGNDSTIAREAWRLARLAIIETKRHRGPKRQFRNTILREIILGVTK